MSPRFLPKPPITLDFPDMADAWMEFYLSRKAKHCTPDTLKFYRNTAFKFVKWAERQGVESPKRITARHVRQYISELFDQGKQDTTCHDHARAIRTLVRFWFDDKIINQPIRFDMPKLQKKQLPILDEEQVRTILRACNTRDKAIVLFMADCGIRNTEVCKLNWGDVDFETGAVRIEQGKGQKDRMVAIGAYTRRALLQYKRKIKNRTNQTPLFLSRKGRFTRHGLLIVYRRLSKATGIHVTPHVMRRTYVILALRKNTDPGHVQRMLGHTSLDMVYYYAQLGNIDLLRIQNDSSPMDGLY
jgi:site-specific recombinase XerD